MAYGAEISDANGRVFARVDGGESYHYWGKVTINNTANWQEVSLFNMPASVPISVFIFCDFGGNENYLSRAGKAEVRQVNGVWKARSYRSFIGETQPSFQSVTFYVFVPARYISALAYGMQCFNSSGVKVYDSSRALMQIAGIGSGDALTTGSATFFNRTPTKTASAYCLAYSAQYIAVQGVPYWAIIFYYGTTTNGQLNGFTGIISDLDSGGTQPKSTQFTNVPLIDAGYYDQFPNLGNM